VGSETDPIVSKSYLEKYVRENSGGATAGAPLFEIIQLSLNQTILLGESTQLILRSGEGTAVAGLNGLSDITEGINLDNNAIVKKDHLLISPKNDGRGIKITSEIAYILVCGNYTILSPQ
jgi:hypothetical protein